MIKGGIKFGCNIIYSIKRRKTKSERKVAEFKESLRDAQNIQLDINVYKPLDNTGYGWKEEELEVAQLGLKFIPTIKRYDTRKIKMTNRKNYQNMKRMTQAHLIVKRKKGMNMNTNHYHGKRKVLLDQRHGQNKALEKFITKVAEKIFDPLRNYMSNVTFQKDNV